MYRNFRTAFLLLVFIFQFKIQESFKIQSTDLNSVNYADELPQEAPTKFVKFFMTESILRISWTAPTNWLGTDNQYLITYAQDGKKQPRVTSNETYHILPGLVPWTKLTFEVQASTTVNEKDILSNPLEGEARVKMQKPGEIRELESTNFTSTSITLKWIEPEEPNGPLDGYDITWTSSNPNSHNSKSVSKAGEEVVLSNLATWVEYDIQVTAYNVQENKEKLLGPTATITQKTDVGKPNPCTSLTIHQGPTDKTTVTFFWTKPQTTNVPIDGYLFTYIQDDTTVGPLPVNRAWEQIKVRNLLLNTNYTLQLVAFNQDMQLPSRKVKSEIAQIEITTNPGEPSEPTELTEGDISQTSLQVKWNPPQEPRGPIAGYILSCDVCDDKEVETSETQYTFKGLKPLTQVSVGVKGYNKAVNPGANRFIGAETKLATGTHPTAPGMPVQLTVSETAKTSITIKWEKPSEPKGDISGYLVYCDGCPNHNVAETNSTEHTIEDLKPWTPVTLKVTAFITAIYSESKAKIEGQESKADGKTLPSAPSEPQEIEKKDVKKTSFKIQWKKPQEPNGPVDGYLLTINVGPLKQTETGKLEHTFDGLKSRTTANVSVAAFNEFGSQRLVGPIQTIQVTTAGVSCTQYSMISLLVSLFAVLLLNSKTNC